MSQSDHQDDASKSAAIPSARASNSAPSDAAPPAYHPMHYRPHPSPQVGVDPLHGAAVEMCHDSLVEERPTGSADGSHGQVLSEGLPRTTKLVQREPERKAAG